MAHRVGDEDGDPVVVELRDVVDIARDLRERTIERGHAHTVQRLDRQGEKVLLDERRELELLVALLELVAHRVDHAAKERELAS